MSIKGGWMTLMENGDHVLFTSQCFLSLERVSCTPEAPVSPEKAHSDAHKTHLRLFFPYSFFLTARIDLPYLSPRFNSNLPCCQG